VPKGTYKRLYTPHIQAVNLKAQHAKLMDHCSTKSTDGKRTYQQVENILQHKTEQYNYIESIYPFFF